jgi:Fe-S-cluster containining protein
VEESYRKDLERAEANRKQYKKQIRKIKRQNPRDLDNVIHRAHEEVFQEVDCLKCANCCTTTGPLWTSRDIERISRYLKMSAFEFETRYLRLDEDGDMVLRELPCPFLGSDNYCSIYDVRPKACREYPHTDRKKQQQILDLTERNARVCPAVSRILDRIFVDLSS